MIYFMLVFHLTVLLAGPIFMLGIINRVKSWWAGRRGPRLYQTWFDLVRLLHKQPVYSSATSWIFPLAPLLILAATLTASLLGPIVPGYTPLGGFPGDFVVFAYLLGLARIFLMLSALDTGSSFEGMGAAREATFAGLAEPVFLLGLGTLSWISGRQSFQDLLSLEGVFTPEAGAVQATVAAALIVVLLIEAARVPADDPATHLELTMVHEVMILDHSGPELAMVQYASALKMTMLAGIVAAMLNPFSAGDVVGATTMAAAASLGLMVLIAVLVGLIESLTARLRFRAVPLFTFSAFMAILLAMVVVIAN